MSQREGPGQIKLFSSLLSSLFSFPIKFGVGPLESASTEAAAAHDYHYSQNHSLCALLAAVHVSLQLGDLLYKKVGGKRGVKGRRSEENMDLTRR